MSIVEMKWKIVQQLDNASEETLLKVLEIVEQNAQKETVKCDLNTGLNERMKENDVLLKRLRQSGD